MADSEGVRLECLDWDSKLKLKKDDPIGDALVDLSALLALPFDEQMRSRHWHLDEFAVPLANVPHGYLVLRARWEAGAASAAASTSTAHAALPPHLQHPLFEASWAGMRQGAWSRPP